MSAPPDREQLPRDLSDALRAILHDQDVTRLDTFAASLTTLEEQPYAFHGPTAPAEPRRDPAARLLDDLIRLYGRPARVRVDNGPELTAEAFVEWCAAQRITIGYIQPGKPDQNAFIERFNRRAGARHQRGLARALQH